MSSLVRCFLLMVAFSVTRQQNSDFTSNVLDIFRSNTNCVCVRHYLCTDNLTLITDGRAVIDIRVDEDKPCPDILEWCCSPNNVTTKVVKPKETNNTGCGWRNVDGVGFRTIGDVNFEAKFGEFPWMVALLSYYMTGDAQYLGGASLIHPRAVITGAHWVSDRTKKYLIRAGEWNTLKNNEIYPYQDRDVKSVVIHPDFQPGALHNNIAFLLLDSPFDLTDPHIAVACLPPQGAVIPSGTTCFATGWGKDKFGQTGKYPIILKKIDLPIVESGSCQNNLRQTRLGGYFELDRSFICAGGVLGKDTCKGDGGSPLVCPIPGQRNRYEQAGIVSWGIGCGDEVPGVYANVALFRNWIDQQATNNKIDSTSYAY